MFGNDGKLYFTTGDTSKARRRRILTSPRGKIHRINPDGTVPTDNPFYDGNGPNVDSIWALGLRNPVPGLLRRTDRQVVRRRRRRQRRLDRAARRSISARAARTTAGPTARAARAGTRRSRSRSTRIRTTAVTRRSREASSITAPVPERLPGQLLLRRLRAELDQAADLRRERQRRPASSTSSRRTVGRRAVRRHRLPHRRPGRRALLRRPRILRHERARSASARSAGSATSSRQPGADRGRGSEPDCGPTPLTVNFSSAGSSDPEGQPLTYSWTFGDSTHVDRGQPEPHLRPSRASTRRG